MSDGPLPHDRPDAVVFDLGGVLIDWNPRHLYRRLFADEVAMEQFLAEVTTPAWNLEQDRGRPFADGIAELVREHPDQAELIEAYWERWPEMLGGPLPDTVAILAELRTKGVRLLALSNWSAETFGIGAPQFPFLAWFEAVIVSGEEGLVKPDPALYRLLIDRHALDPAMTVFIDDSVPNVEAAVAIGFRAIPFTGADPLRRDLTAMGLLDATGESGSVILRAPDPPLSDGIVSLRPPDERDLEAIDRGIHDPDVIRWFGRPPGSAGDVLALNRDRWRDGSPTFAVCEMDGRCVGHVWLNASRRDPDAGSVGYWLLPSVRGRGLATRAVRLLVPWAIEALGLRQVRLVTESTNEPSRRVAERSGFARIGSEPGRSELDGRAVELIVFAWPLAATERP